MCALLGFFLSNTGPTLCQNTLSPAGLTELHGLLLPQLSVVIQLQMYICWVTGATRVWPSFCPSFLPSFLCSPLSVFCFRLFVSASEWVAAIFCVCAEFINIRLLGDKLMSPGSSDWKITTFFFFFWDTFCVLHYSWCSTLKCCEPHWQGNKRFCFN